MPNNCQIRSIIILVTSYLAPEEAELPASTEPVLLSLHKLFRSSPRVQIFRLALMLNL